MYVHVTIRSNTCMSQIEKCSCSRSKPLRYNTMFVIQEIGLFVGIYSSLNDSLALHFALAVCEDDGLVKCLICQCKYIFLLINWNEKRKVSVRIWLGLRSRFVTFFMICWSKASKHAFQVMVLDTLQEWFLNAFAISSIAWLCVTKIIAKQRN